MHRVLGIDPGLRITGYGALEVETLGIDPKLIEAGVLRLVAKDPLERRLVQLQRDLDQLIDDLEPTCLAVENLYAHYRHPQTAVLMGHARGVILLCAQRRGLAIAHLPSTEVKKAVTGYGHASKEQIQQSVADQLGLDTPPSPADVGDAIAIALTHIRRLAMTEL